MIMLEATRGFNHGPDETRVEVGDRLDDDFAAPEVIDALLLKGAIVPVIDDTRPARGAKTKKSSPTTPDDSQGGTEAHSGDEEAAE